MNKKTPYIIGGGVLLAVGAVWLYTKSRASAPTPVQGAPVPEGAPIPDSDAILSISKLLSTFNAAAPSGGGRAGLGESSSLNGASPLNDASALSDSAPLYMRVGGIQTLTVAGVEATRKQLANARGMKSSVLDGVTGMFFAPENTGPTYDEYLRASMDAGNTVLMMLEELKATSVKQAYRISMPTSRLAEYLSKSVSDVPQTDIWVIVA
jgi:hypothetical protein